MLSQWNRRYRTKLSSSNRLTRTLRMSVVNKSIDIYVIAKVKIRVVEPQVLGVLIKRYSLSFGSGRLDLAEFF